MTCSESNQTVLNVIRKSDPTEYQIFVDKTPESVMHAVSAFMVIETPPVLFKGRPDGATNFACYLIAEFNYAQGLYLCGLISDTQLRKACKINVKQAYCDAYDACGLA